VGSINAAAIASFPIGLEKNATDFVYQFWKNLTNKDIWKTWTGF
jgi:hypothetical protein